MSIEARPRKLEAEVPADETWDLRPLDIIGRVERVVRLSLKAAGQNVDTRYRAKSPTTDAAISEAVRACLEVIETQGARAGRQGAQALEAELLPPDPNRILIRDLQADVERAAFRRGDLTGTRRYPEK